MRYNFQTVKIQWHPRFHFPLLAVDAVQEDDKRRSSQMRAPAILPKRPSKPRSAHRRRLSRPLCTSATCMFIRLTSVAPSVQARHLRSPWVGMDWPFATSDSMPLRAANEGRMGIASAAFLGRTVSHAPESAVNSTSIHSSAGHTHTHTSV